MECLYLPETDLTTRTIVPNESEQKHIKALRLKQDEKIMITNGRGYCFIACVNYDKSYNPTLEVEMALENYGEEDCSIDILICNIADKNRLEWAVEKSTELGVSQIFLKNCYYSQIKKIDLNRLTNKAISAIKQCKRSKLPKINILESKDFLPEEFVAKYQKIVVLDENGRTPIEEQIASPILLVVGPEGGLHSKELLDLNNISKIVKWKIGKRRLRTETAIVAAISIALGIMK